MGKVTLSHPESAHQLILDEETGLLGGLIFIENSVNREVSIASTITLQIDGSERRAATGGLEYFDTKKQRPSHKHDINLYDLMKSLGHKNLSTTQGYIQSFVNKRVDNIGKGFSDMFNVSLSPNKLKI
jgi:hypothetical protein